MRSGGAKIAVISLIALVLLVFLPFCGYVDIPFSGIFEESQLSGIFWNIRVPRTLAAFLCGAVLALCGMVFQSMFRNDLATPYTLGVSSGAALGAVCAIKFFAGAALVLPLTQIFSFTGALATVAFIWFLTGIKKRSDTAFLLLSGVAVSFICSGLILFIQYIASGSESSMMVHWMMGSLDISGMQALVPLLSALVLMTAVSLFFHRELDLMRIDSDIASTRGVNMKFVCSTLFLVVSVSVALVVSAAGPIGFIGMMAPHIAGRFIGRRHRELAFVSLLAGGILLMAADAVSRTVAAPSEIPVGVVTSLIGGPFFLAVLAKSGK